MRKSEIEWKESLLKSVIYRIITVILGFLTAFIITGELTLAIGVALLTEAIQFVNYFVFEVLWINLITKKRLENIFRKKIIDIEIDYDSILEIAYNLSQTNTYIKEVYDSALNFFTSILTNKQLKELHPKISEYYEIFERKHSERELASYESTQNSELKLE